MYSVKRIIQTREIIFIYRIFSITKHPGCSTYKHTILLPKTNFQHKINSIKRREQDRLIENSVNFDELYDWQSTQTRKKEFILHDGPPYSNGDVHIGHAVNKILKDITNRYKLLQGYKIHYVPGWDCHGLPIELKVLKNSVDNNKLDISVREKAYEFSQQAQKQQLASFKEWGLLADWKNSYITCHPNYVINQLKIFQDLCNKGIIYQDHKPVFWSPSNQTSLAEAELEYNVNHISSSIYVKFVVVQYPDSMKSFIESDCNLNLLIWTTTPWTLPANQAVCYSSEKIYCIVKNKSQGEYYIVAEEMISSLSKVLRTELISLYSFQGSCLNNIKYSHPVFKNRNCFLFPSAHVTMTKGTGLVHTAPKHGFDDYFVAKNQNLLIDVCLVDDSGKFTSDAGKELAGKAVLSDGSKQIIDMLKNDIVCIEDYVHSYPYDWRSKTPVFIKSSHQWFIDVQRYRSEAMDYLESIKVYPDHLKKQFLNLLSTSPQWCISRQRVWGVPIPAFYTSESKSPIVHQMFTDHLCNLIKKHGIHCWWELDINELLPSNLIEKCRLPPNVPYKRGTDIMDIWLDSGISWKIVLPEPNVSDVCIEGVDQIRGWFYTSLMTSIAIRGKAPYKSLLFHGFTTDANGRKMSKSEGNVISPIDVICGSKVDKIPAYGVDVLRWWVASHACQHENIAVKMQILEECSQNINKLRNLFKFLLGSLFEFNLTEDIITPDTMRPLDVYMLHLLKRFWKKVEEDYDKFQFKNVAKEIINFTTNDVSSFYCHLIKDRLYCDRRDSAERLSCQTVLYFILNTLAQSIGPICPHLAEEILMHHPSPEYAKEGLFRSNFPSVEKFLFDIPVPTCINYANQVRQTLLKAEIRTSNLDLFVVGSNVFIDTLKQLNLSDESGCIEFFQASSVTFCKEFPSSLKAASVINGHIMHTEEKLEPFIIVTKETSLMKCPRCRRYSSIAPSLCNRCLNIINKESKISSKA